MEFDNFSPELLDAKGTLLHKAIILRHMDDTAIRKASEEHGYCVAVTTLNSIGEGKVRDLPGDVRFPGSVAWSIASTIG